MTNITLEQIIENSAFNKQSYVVNIPIRKFIKSIMFYINDDIENPTYKDILKYGVPNFQRDNNKWTENMQIKFVENIIKGFVSKIQLFELKNNSKSQILDGYQRITALSSFIEGKFKVFNNSISFSDIENTILKGINKNIIIEIFKFDNLNDVIDFYVEMNENITHSPEDIKKALSFKI
jgi:hypothetical protein